MITPRCTGSTPKARATGTMSGATTMIAEKISITQPSTTMTTFRIIRKIQGELIVASIHTVSRSGTCSVIRRFVRPMAVPRIRSTPPTSRPHSVRTSTSRSPRGRSRLTIAATRIA